MDFDYKKILLAYIDHVLGREGTTFLNQTDDVNFMELQADELAQLQQLGKEVYSKSYYNKGNQ